MFNHVTDMPGELSFNAGDIMHVKDTMYNDQPDVLVCAQGEGIHCRRTRRDHSKQEPVGIVGKNNCRKESCSKFKTRLSTQRRPEPKHFIASILLSDLFNRFRAKLRSWLFHIFCAGSLLGRESDTILLVIGFQDFLLVGFFLTKRNLVL